MEIEKFMNSVSQPEWAERYIERLAEVSARTQQRFEELNGRLIRVEQELKRIQEKEVREMARQATLRQNADSVSATETLRAQLMDSAARSLQQKRFWWVGGSTGASFDKRMMLYDSVSKLLWVPPDADAACIGVLPARSLASMSRVGGLSGWRFPANQEVIDFSSQPSNPLRSGSSCRLLNNFAFFTSSHRIDLDDFSLWNLGYSGVVTLCNDLLSKCDSNQVVQAMIERLWSLHACDASGADILQPLR